MMEYFSRSVEERGQLHACLPRLLLAKEGSEGLQLPLLRSVPNPPLLVFSSDSRRQCSVAMSSVAMSCRLVDGMPMS